MAHDTRTEPAGGRLTRLVRQRTSVSVQEYVGVLEAEIRRLQTTISLRFGGLTEAQLDWAPPEGGWGVRDCLAHVMCTDLLYLDEVTRALDADRSRDRPGTFRTGPIASLFLSTAASPARKRKLKTLSIFAPENTRTGTSVATVIAHLEHLIGVVRECSSRDLRGTKIPSPASSLIRFQLGDSLALLVEHASRHVNQALDVCEHEGFSDV